ncbi:MAG TPA: M20/M25/M40 family metallo-hydrolase [Gaiellaceae bacterium]|nr:M20/M25/M40 family metallo-hydrolase [Gaiellaceae bacterium]
MTEARALALTVSTLLPELKGDLARLVAIPSVSAPGFPEETHGPLLEAYEAVAGLFRDAGVDDVGPLELPGTAPIVVGEIPAPAGAPTVLLYSHYDVVPAGDESAWDSPPFEATERAGAIYGRGTADTKSNILVHVGALRAWNGRPPVGVKLLIEGQEEVGSVLEEGYPSEHPEQFHAEALLIADGGNIRPGEPSLTVSIRGDAAVTVGVRTLASPKHSGQYGGAAPDALLALLHGLASLHDERGNVAVEGLRRDGWTGVTDTDEEFRELAEVEPGLPLFGTGGLGERTWTGPAITVTGIDVPSVEGALNAVSAHARAKLNIRIHPEQPAAEAQAAVVRHLEARRPFGIPLQVHTGGTGDGFRGKTSGPAWDAMAAAMETAFGTPPVQIATGGAIPLVKALADGVPDATVLLFGTTDKFANIHGPNERVLVDELEKAVLAEALFFAELVGRWKEAR